MHWHVQDAVTKFSKNLKLTGVFKISLFRVHTRYLSSWLQGGCTGSSCRASVQSSAWSRGHPETSGVTSSIISLVSGRASGLVWAYFSDSGMKWYVLCCSPCGERCYEIMSFEVTTGLEDLVCVHAFHLSLVNVSSCYSGALAAAIPSLNYSYLANMVFYADTFYLTKFHGVFWSHQVITCITVFRVALIL